MDLLQQRPGGNAVQARQFFTQQAALQPGVDRRDLRFGAVLLPVHFTHPLTQRAFLPVFPGRIVAGNGDAAAQQAGQRRQPLGQHFLLAGQGAAHPKVQLRRVLPGGQDPQIQRGLHQTGQSAAHRLDAVRRRQQHTQHPFGAVLGHGGIGLFPDRLHPYGQRRLRRGVLPPQLFLPPLGQRGQRFGAVGHQHCRGLGGDGVILQPAGKRDHPAGNRLPRRRRKPAQQHIGIGPPLVDLHPGVAAGQPGDGHRHTLAGHRFPLYRQPAAGAVAAGAADGKNTLLLGIEIDHAAAGHQRGLQRRRAQHPDLLIAGDDALQPGGRQRLIGQQRQHHRHRNTVVAAQRRPPGKYPAVFLRQLQSLGLHILMAAGGLFTHHIQVPLQHHRRSVFVPRRRLLDDDHIIVRVPAVLQAAAGGKLLAVVGDPFGIARTVRDAADLLKIIKYLFGLQMAQYAHGHASFRRFRRVAEQHSHSSAVLLSLYTLAARRVNPPACDSFVKSAKSTGLFITYSQKYGRFFGLSFTFL